MSEPCAECGFDWASTLLANLRVIDQLPAGVQQLVVEAGDSTYQRPEPTVWSANEYTWHLADTLRAAAEWLHDIRTEHHPTHFAIDADALAATRRYENLLVGTGIWSLEQACHLFIGEAAVTDPERTCYYHDWQDVTVAQVVGFMAHEAVHHVHDIRRVTSERITNYAS